MNAISAAGVLLAHVAAATAAGLVWRARSGRAKAVGEAVAVLPADVGAASFGESATLLQFSTEFCSACPATARILGTAAGARDGVSHVDVDLTHRPDLARRFGVLQTPTTLVLDAAGTVRARIGGPARPAEVGSVLDRILGSDHVPA